MSTGSRRAAVIFIFITVVLDVLALGVIIPVLPRLVADFVGGDTSRAAQLYGLFGTTWALMQFVCAPILGSLSDRFGRRPVILLSSLGLGLDYILMALAPTLSWLFAGRVLSGMTAAGFSSATAYIADITSPDKRAASFGMLGAAFGLGFVLGPALGGLLGGTDPRLPFWVAAALTLLNVGYGAFVLPESLAPENRRDFSWRRANPLGALTLLRTQAGLVGLASMNLLYQLSHQVLPAVFVLYTGYRYGWGEQRVGISLAGVGVCSMIVQGALVRPFVKRFGERVAVLVGLSFGVIGFSIYGLAPTTAAFLVGVPAFALVGLFSPAVQSLMTQRVGAEEQGQLQGVSSSLMGLTGLVGPALFAMTFSYFIGAGQSWQLPGAPFLLAGAMLLVALAIAVWITRAHTVGRPKVSAIASETAGS